MAEAELKKRINEDLKQAMKSGDTARRSTLRLLLSAVHNGEIARRQEYADGDIIGVIAKEIKQRQESIEAYRQGKREDLVAKETAEMNVLQGYMPQQLSRDEVTETARRIIAEVGASGPGDKGKVMPKIMAELKGRADGRIINEVVTGLLNA